MQPAITLLTNFFVNKRAIKLTTTNIPTCKEALSKNKLTKKLTKEPKANQIVTKLTVTSSINTKTINNTNQVNVITNPPTKFNYTILSFILGYNLIFRTHNSNFK